ncbi:MAG: carboxypeptidase regulatory-like domain-containing protein [Alphaproteobacteria bacterium]|nr:carboxypeptidase regulatory-like domain-containing protein [Alphaproteobacteria bacterium]
MVLSGIVLTRRIILTLCVLLTVWGRAGAQDFGLKGDDTGGQLPPPAIGDLFKSDGAADTRSPLPAAGPEPGSSILPSTPGAVSSRPIVISYDGQAAADGRRARIELSLAPDGAATGKIVIQSICEQNVHLGGADLTFNGQLSGTWESKTASIDGEWQGTEHFCGTDQQNNGAFKFFRKEEAAAKPVLHLRLTGKRGRYGWNFPPTDRKYLSVKPSSATVASGGEDGSAGKDGAPPPEVTEDGSTSKTKPDKTGRDGATEEDIDPDRVTGILLLPSETTAAPGEPAERPTVFAIMGDTADKVPVPDDLIEWTLPRGLAIENQAFMVSGKAKDGDRIPFSVKVKLSLTKRFEAEGTVHVSTARFGSIAGRVYMSYNYPRIRGGPQVLRKATVELHPNGDGPPLRRTVTGPDGSYRFDRLPQGGYQVVVTGFQHDDFPDGYRLDKPNGPWKGYVTWIPKYKDYFHPDPETATWDHEKASVEIELIGPDYDARPDAVSGRIIYKDNGVKGVTVRADRLGSEGGGTRVTSGTDGRYTIWIKDLEPGTYWLRAEKYVVSGWAGPDDLLDVASARDERSVLFTVPFFGVDRISLDIEVLTRHEIFGGERGPEQPVDLP